MKYFLPGGSVVLHYKELFDPVKIQKMKKIAVATSLFLSFCFYGIVQALDGKW
jgi:hypothetical protein